MSRRCPPPRDALLFDRRQLSCTVLAAARALLGAQLVHSDAAGQVTAGFIVEVEAYGADDPASHSVRGQTRRNASMFGSAGLAYVYRSYGIHWCLNVVVGPPARGEAVLLRALRPSEGEAVMQARRGGTARVPAALCRGPGNVCRAMGIDGGHDGVDLLAPDGALTLREGCSVPSSAVAAGPRIGIRLAPDWPWRLWLRGEPTVSSPRSEQILPKPPVKRSNRRPRGR